MLTFISNNSLTELIYMLNSFGIYITYNNNVINMTFPNSDYTLYIYCNNFQLQIGICMNTLNDQQTNAVLLWHLNYNKLGNDLIFNLLQKLLYIKGVIFNQYYNYIEIYDNINYFIVNNCDNSLCVSYYKNI